MDSTGQNLTSPQPCTVYRGRSRNRNRSPRRLPQIRTASFPTACEVSADKISPHAREKLIISIGHIRSPKLLAQSSRLHTWIWSEACPVSLAQLLRIGRHPARVPASFRVVARSSPLPYGIICYTLLLHLMCTCSTTFLQEVWLAVIVSPV